MYQFKMVRPADVREGDTFCQGQTPVWTATADAVVFDHDGDKVAIQVRYEMDGGMSVRHWSAAEVGPDFKIHVRRGKDDA